MRCRPVLLGRGRFLIRLEKYMNANVNENCIGCGLCAGNCPEVFNMGDDGLAHGGNVPDGMLDSAQNARDECPVSAISIG